MVSSDSTHAVDGSNANIGLRIANARLEFDGDALFENLSFDVSGGQWTCILGPSGVGKSSLLRMIAGLAVTHRNTEICAADGSSLDQQVTWMAQNDLLLPWLTAARNVTIGSRLRGTAEDAAQTEALLRAVGLADHLQAMPKTLSGGERQRVALARTLKENRPVVLMDEPFSAVDAITRARLQELSARLLVGRTVVLVTHDPLEALRLGHRIHVMAGRPAQLGAALSPPGVPPRDPTDPQLRALHADLLAQLSRAAPKPAAGNRP